MRAGRRTPERSEGRIEATAAGDFELASSCSRRRRASPLALAAVSSFASVRDQLAAPNESSSSVWRVRTCAIASRPHHRLEHHDDAPQLPAAYASMLLVALVPPLWFRMMDPRVEAWHRGEARLSLLVAAGRRSPARPRIEETIGY